MDPREQAEITLRILDLAVRVLRNSDPNVKLSDVIDEVSGKFNEVNGKLKL